MPTTTTTSPPPLHQTYHSHPSTAFSPAASAAPTDLDAYTRTMHLYTSAQMAHNHLDLTRDDAGAASGGGSGGGGGGVGSPTNGVPSGRLPTSQAGRAASAQGEDFARARRA